MPSYNTSLNQLEKQQRSDVGIHVICKSCIIFPLFPALNCQQSNPYISQFAQRILFSQRFARQIACSLSFACFYCCIVSRVWKYSPPEIVAPMIFVLLPVTDIRAIMKVWDVNWLNDYLGKQSEQPNYEYGCKKALLKRSLKGITCSSGSVRPLSKVTLLIQWQTGKLSYKS